VKCANCGKLVEAGFKLCPYCGTELKKSADIKVGQDIGTVKGDVTGTILGKGATTGGISASTDQKVDTVESGGTVVGTVVGGEEGNIHVGGEQRYGETIEGDKKVVNTEGGAYTEGDVNVQGGDFVGRDKISGDKVGGDKITVGDISGSSGIAIGRNASASVTQTQGISGAELAALFAPLEQAVQSAPADNQAEAQEKLQDLEAEVAKGDEADDSRMAGLLNDLVDLVPSAVGATVSVFASPILGGIAGPVTDFVLKRLGAK
jgi:hypothetical protein